MSGIPRKLQQDTRLRAKGCCEYCQISQLGQEAEFHIDHVVPQACGGLTSIDNLALACVSCSLRKGAKETGIDPLTKTIVSIFNPRLFDWKDHFLLSEGRVEGQTSIGRATVDALAMNRVRSVEIRLEQQERDRHPKS